MSSTCKDVGISKTRLINETFRLLKSLNLDWSKEVIPDHIFNLISEFAIDLRVFTQIHSEMGSTKNVGKV